LDDYKPALSHPETECEHCTETFTAGYNQAYCSGSCYYRERGASFFEQLHSDHTHCSTCFAQKKVVSPPTPDWKQKNGEYTSYALSNGGFLDKHNGKQVLDVTEAIDRRPLTTDVVIGFEYHTENYIKEHGFSWCVCGTGEHYASDTTIRAIELQKTIYNLFDLLQEYTEQEQFGDNTPDLNLLCEELKRTNLDWEESIGRAIYG